MANRDRGVKLNFWVTPEEKTLIQSQMNQAGVKNMSAYIRKMAIDGYYIHVDFSELLEIIKTHEN